MPADISVQYRITVNKGRDPERVTLETKPDRLRLGAGSWVGWGSADLTRGEAGEIAALLLRYAHTGTLPCPAEKGGEDG